MENGNDRDTLDVLNSELVIAQSSVNDATVWNLRADGNRLRLWHSTLTAGLDKAVLWDVNAEKAMSKITTKLRDMDNRSLTTHAHQKKQVSTSEFLVASKLEAGGNLFCSGDEQLMNVALMASVDTKTDDKRAQVKGILLSTVKNERLNMDMPGISLEDQNRRAETRLGTESRHRVHPCCGRCGS